MKTSLLILLLALAGCSVKIKGHWDADLRDHWIGENHLEAGGSYVIRNGTSEAFYVWLLDDRAPIEYFPIMPGGSQRFESPGDSFDIYGLNDRAIRGVSLWWIPN